MKKILLVFFITLPLISKAQISTETSFDSLRKEILSLKGDVENIQINLVKAQKNFKRGITTATIGYSLTIAGGLMLGRKNDDLGKALLVAGGITGITGTILMVDAFKYLGRGGKSKRTGL
jgi:hypothetical protein